MNELQIFNSEEFGDIRTVQLNNEIRDHPEWLQRLKECGVSDL